MTDEPADGLAIPEFLRRAPEPKFHPLAEMFPLMEGDEFNNLVEDIEKNGLVEAITTKDGVIVDGRNRYLACKTARYKFKDGDFVELPPDVDVLAYIVSKNIQRRHLTAEGKRNVIAELLKANPESSSRAIAFLVRCSHHTVEAVRNDMAADEAEEDEDGETEDQSEPSAAPAPDATGQTAQLRKGRDGKKRRQRKPKRAPAAPTSKELMAQVDDFKAEWDSLNVWQRSYFVTSRKDGRDGIIAILDEIKQRQGVVDGEPAEQDAVEPVEHAPQLAEEPAGAPAQN